MDLVQPHIVPIAIQAAGVLMVAGLLRPLTRVVPGTFLVSWWVGWVVLAVGLMALCASSHFDVAPTALGALFCVSEYLFGYLLWLGCREFALGRAPTRSDLMPFAPLAGFGIVAPLAFPQPERLFAVHTAVQGTLFAVALAALLAPRVMAGAHSTGFWLLRVSLAGLTAVCWFAVPIADARAAVPGGAGSQLLGVLALYELLLETGLAFGMVLVAADRMRAELEAKNRQLAAAAEELSRAARTDALTGLFNRRAWDALPTEVSEQYAGCLAVLDLNDLKPLNDRFGHPAGDAALQTVARALRGYVRVTDPIFRIGGDEFAVVMPGGDSSELAHRMARLDVELLGCRLPGVPGPRDLAVAWGVATFSSAAELSAAFARADGAMYAQKVVRKTAPPCDSVSDDADRTVVGLGRARG